MPGNPFGLRGLFYVLSFVKGHSLLSPYTRVNRPSALVSFGCPIAPNRRDTMASAYPMDADYISWMEKLIRRIETTPAHFNTDLSA